MTQPTIDQLRNLTDRTATGLTPDEQQRLREGIDALHAELAEAWQKFATVAAQRDRLRTRMNNLADRWDHALAPDKPYARALRAEISIEPLGTDATPQPTTRTCDDPEEWEECDPETAHAFWAALAQHTATRSDTT